MVWRLSPRFMLGYTDDVLVKVEREPCALLSFDPARSPCFKVLGALCEQGRMHHIGSFPWLEDQMTNFTSDFDREAAGYLPNRLDALIWAATELLVEPMLRSGPRQKRDQCQVKAWHCVS
jgi:hypothetical protein